MVHVVPFGGFNGDGFASCDRYCLMSRLDLDSGVAEVGGERPWTGKGACVVGQSTVRSRFAGGEGTGKAVKDTCSLTASLKLARPLGS